MKKLTMKGIVWNIILDAVLEALKDYNIFYLIQNYMCLGIGTHINKNLKTTYIDT